MLDASTPTIIDAHAHCGIIDSQTPQSFEDYERAVRDTDIDGAAFFSPVLEIYDRWSPTFEDTPVWQRCRRESNEYLLGLDPPDFAVFPYFFIWNDFAVDQLTEAHCGIKWHRHADEPSYRYDLPECRDAIDEIRRRNLPVVLEEELHNTLRFARDLADGVTVIIPHLGLLNGGFEALADAGLWDMDTVWADTALAPRADILAYIERYGHHRLLFGSDFPFGGPAEELDKVRSLWLPTDVETAVLGGNFFLLQSGVIRTAAVD